MPRTSIRVYLVLANFLVEDLAIELEIRANFDDQVAIAREIRAIVLEELATDHVLVTQTFIVADAVSTPLGSIRVTKIDSIDLVLEFLDQQAWHALGS